MLITRLILWCPVRISHRPGPGSLDTIPDVVSGDIDRHEYNYRTQTYINLYFVESVHTAVLEGSCVSSSGPQV